MSDDNGLSINLDDLKDIMADLEPAGTERRKNNLTQDDVLVIAKIIQAVTGRSCSMGLSEQEVSFVKKWFATLNKGAMAVGWLVVSFLVTAVIGLTVMGIKHSIYDIATKGVK